MSTPRILSIALAAALFAPGVALAQGIPGGGGGGMPGGGAGGGAGGGGSGGGSGAAGMPSKQEIEKKVKEYLDGLPDREAEMGRIKVIYKPVPSDPIEIVKASGQLPAGANADQAAKQALPLARPYIEKSLGEIGRLIADVEFKYKSAKLVPAEYVFGVVMQTEGAEMIPVAVVLSGKALKSPVKIPLKPANATQPYASLTVEVKAGKKEGEFTIDVGFGKYIATSAKLELKK